MTNLSNQDNHYNGDSQSSPKQLPATQSEAVKSKIMNCKATVTEPRATNSKAAESKASSSIAEDSIVAEFKGNDLSVSLIYCKTLFACNATTV